MLEFVSTLLTLCFFSMAVRLVFKMAWGAAKLAVTILLIFALPALILCLIFASGILLFVPVGLALAAFALVKVFV